MNCTNLVELRLESNNLEGDISMFDFSKLSQLTKLDLRKNNFTGTVPRSLYSCRSLKAIGLFGNHLEGQIEAEILSLKFLSFLSLGYNRFTNLTGAMKILMSCKSLHALLLSGSFVGEGLPSDDDMVDFHGFQNLRLLGLSYSNLTGQIPMWLSKLKNLEILFLSFNQITGPTPSWLGNLPRLFFISLQNNRLSGEFPQQLCQLARLLYEPNIASQVEEYEFELPVAGSSISINSNQRFPQQLLPQRKLYFLPGWIVLSNNNISGYIPAEIGQLRGLRKLALNSNNFSGIIPDQISNLKNLEVLDLSTNHLSGIIPSSLASLNFLKEFNASYNNLEGPIPTGTQLQSFNASAFEGNPKLCGAPLPNKCRPIKDMDADNKNNKDEGNGHHQLPWFYIFVTLGFIVGFWGVCGSLVINKTWRYAYFQFIDNLQDRLYVMIS
ncbi:receptor like protein 3 [Prunus dulcis]|uniref:Receptor like protein 3 n=1 Tax=Prunus dulcis TaxID=3755 RepID=A0A4Y1RCG5_PRUDU|nr:receptor like protein 3 [Prunus dulcis]